MPLTFVNSGFERITGYARAEVVGRNCRFLQGPETDTQAIAELRNAIADGRHITTRLLNYRKDGSTFWNNLVVSPVHDAAGALVGFVGVQHDVTPEVVARQELAEKIEELEATKRRLDLVNADLQRIAYFDPLTGLPTRRLLQDRLARSLARSKRTGTMVALMFLDLDDFKQVNDTLGHQAGDLLLRQVAERIGERLRQADTLSRLGGDEYVVLLDTLVSQEAVSAVSDRIAEAFKPPFDLGEAAVHLGVSIGTAFYPRDGADARSLMAAADAAMYRSKRRKRRPLDSDAHLTGRGLGPDGDPIKA